MQFFIEKALQSLVVLRATRIQFLVVHIYFLVVIDIRTGLFS